MSRSPRGVALISNWLEMYHRPVLKPIPDKGNRVTTNGRDQIRLTLGLVVSPGFPEVQGCPTTEQDQESLTLESGK